MWPAHSHVIIFSGEASAIAATATAVAASNQGQSTLLVSLAPAHPCVTLLGVPLAPQPTTLTGHLDLWTFQILSELNSVWNELQAQLNLPGPPISGEDLPLLPGIDLFLAVYRLAQHARRSYALICVDAGSVDGLLRALAVPDTFRWLMRQLFGLDRGPGQSSDSLARAALPAHLLPFEQIGRMQDARVKFEQLRDAVLDPTWVRARLVIRPDQAGLRQAIISVPAFHLFGLNLDALIVGPLLPTGKEDSALADARHEQNAVVAAVATRWSGLRQVPLFFRATPGAIAPFVTLGRELMLPLAPLQPPITVNSANAPYLSLFLPGVNRDDLSISVSGDELIVSLGPYRRHLLLPPALRGVPIRAIREGDRLTIQRR